MARKTLGAQLPYKHPVVGMTPRDMGMMTAGWMQAVQLLAEAVGGFEADAAYDWPSIASGGTAQATVTVSGVKLGDFAVASTNPTNAGLILTAQVTAADSITVTAQNISGGAIDLGAGTVRVRIWSRAT